MDKMLQVRIFLGFFFIAWMITCHRNCFLIWWIKYLHLAFPDPKFMGDVKAGCIKGKRHLVFKAPLTEAITPNGVFGSSERDGLLKKKKRKSPKRIHSQRRSTFDFSFNSLTYTLCATANISQADRRKQRRPLRKPAVRTLKNSKEERKGDRERVERARKNIPQRKCWLEQGRHGKILIFHARKQHYAPRKTQTL